jgi:hypothetical protein
MRRYYKSGGKVKSGGKICPSGKAWAKEKEEVMAHL